MKHGDYSTDASAVAGAVRGLPGAGLALLSALPAPCRADDPLAVGRLSMSPLDGPELPILLLLVGCLALGLAIGSARSRRRPPPAGPTPPPTGAAEAGIEPPPERVERALPAGWLIAIDGPPRRHAIEALPFRIGRAMANDLVLTDTSVSRFHAEVDLRPDGAIAITDLDSLNGVFIGGKRVTQSRLFDGCRLEIGDVAFRYTREPPAVAEGGTLIFTLPERRRSARTPVN